MRRVKSVTIIVVAILQAFFVAATPGLSLAEAGTESTQKPLKKITIDADSMVADKAKNSVVFKGHVVAKEDFTLCAEELKIFYNDKNEVTDITATGKVAIFQQGKTARAERLVYDRNDGDMTLTGSPVLSQCGDEVRGETIKFNVDDETVFVEAGEGGRVRAVIMPEKDCGEEARIEEDLCRRAR